MISKEILNRINKKTTLCSKQLKSEGIENISSVVKWFKKIVDRHLFNIMFDIKDFYSSIQNIYLRGSRRGFTVCGWVQIMECGQ